MDTSCCINWKSLGGMNDLDFNCCSYGSSPFSILLFGLIHFKWLEWIIVADNEGHLRRQDDLVRMVMPSVGCQCNLEVSGASEGHMSISNP